MEGLQQIDAVIGHARNLHTNPFKHSTFTFQLDQLALAEGSPVRRAVEENQQAI